MGSDQPRSVGCVRHLDQPIVDQACGSQVDRYDRQRTSANPLDGRQRIRIDQCQVINSRIWHIMGETAYAALTCGFRKWCWARKRRYRRPGHRAARACLPEARPRPWRRARVARCRAMAGGALGSLPRGGSRWRLARLRRGRRSILDRDFCRSLSRRAIDRIRAAFARLSVVAAPGRRAKRLTFGRPA